MALKTFDVRNIVGDPAVKTANLVYDGINYIFYQGIYPVGPDWTGSVTETIIRDSAGEASDDFGYAVAVKGDNIVVGITGDNFYGGAKVYTLSGGSWTEGTKLEQSDTGSGDQLGYAVDISSDGLYVVAGNPYDEEETSGFNYVNFNYGAAYIFYYNGSSWSQQAKIKPSDRGQYDTFGTSVAMNDAGDYMLAGAPGWDSTGADARGAAYVFTRSGSTWTQQARLEASDAQDFDNLGAACDITADGDYAIVSSTLEDGGGSGDARRGAAYVFARSGSTWTQQAKLTASDAQDNDRFGFSVGISDDGLYAIVGSFLEDGGSGDPISGVGSAYVFTRSGSTWTQQAILRPSDGQTNDFFGGAVKINTDGTFAVVSAYNEDGGSGDPLSNAGAVYVFERDDTTWTEVKKITASDAQAGDNFGQGVDISSDGSRIVVGAPNEDGGSGDPVSDQGAVYIFDA